MGRLRRERRRESGSAGEPKPAPLLGFGALNPGLDGPQPSPDSGGANALGPPLSIGEVATLIGCSTWTVRQKFLPLGLPHFRVSRTGKLLFYQNQLIRWLLRRQKGET